MTLELQEVNKTFAGTPALEDISLEIRNGETTVIVGPSGSGKSTLLRCINLLEIPEKGKLQLGDILINFAEKKFLTKRNKNYVVTRRWFFKTSTCFLI